MPSTANDRLSGLLTSTAVKPPCRTISTTNITLAGLQTVGGVVLAEDDRVLVAGQDDGTENGIYNASTSDWTRAKDFDGNRDVVEGTLILVINSGVYEVTADDPITIGTTDITIAARLIVVDQPTSVLNHGIIPNSIGAATANTAALKALISPASSGGVSAFKGEVIFPNITGSDVYYFNDFFPFRDGISIDACNCTWHFTKAGSAADAQAGFIMAIRDFRLKNVFIEVDYTMVGTTANAGCGIFLGGRGTDTGGGDPFGPIWDSLLSSPMGNITLSNVHVSSNVAGGTGILMFGGLQNVIFDNVSVNGQGVLSQGIYYEFGWATDETDREDRQTSHLHNAHFRNIRVDDLETATTGIGFGLGGAYDTTVENLYINGCRTYISCTPGEALNYRPWVDVDDAGAGRAVVFRNTVGAGATSTAVVLSGAVLASGYLNPLGLGPKDETDLADYVFDGFAFLTGGSGHCVRSNAGKVAIKNGTIRGYNRGIVIENECTNYLIESVDIFDSASIGIQCGLDNNIFATERQAMGTIRNCFIAGSGTAGTSAAISADWCDSLMIEACRFGYTTAHDGVTETTQAQGVTCGVSANNVRVVGCIGGATSGAAVMYANAGAGSSARGQSIENASGVVTTSGLWEGVLQAATPVLTASTAGDLAVTYSQQVIEYIKKGSRVDYVFRIETSAFTHTTASGSVRITGLPYTVNAANYGRVQGSLAYSGITKANYTQFTPESIPSQAYLEIFASGSAQTGAALAITEIPTGGTVILRGSGHYFV